MYQCTLGAEHGTGSMRVWSYQGSPAFYELPFPYHQTAGLSLRDNVYSLILPTPCLALALVDGILPFLLDNAMLRRLHVSRLDHSYWTGVYGR